MLYGGLVWQLSLTKLSLYLFPPHLVFYDRKHFCSSFSHLSNLSQCKWPFLFHQFPFAKLRSEKKIGPKKFLQNTFQKCRNSRSQMFFKIRHLKNFAIFTRKCLCWSTFLMTWRPATFKKEIFPWLLLKRVEDFNLTLEKFVHKYL